MKYNNCIDCPSYEITPDPDPYDWFCDDDVKVRCKVANNQLPKFYKDGSVCTAEPYITVACRPHHVREECNVPSWCPLNNLEKWKDIMRDIV